ncbi:RagB/SusD family nutrient uptake outer membrane protein [Olivibacter ginsenosidimutans]|uniref:RagB/SusD family nutrient uptake outer membrane protein n=1 Tax=Olivibacter ginsenosidimutans TaxID=1176537 RepID=A0ABP9C4D5_9SPHI
MKKNINRYIILIGGLIISSCSKDFLTKYPEGSLNEGNFYASETDFQQAVVGAYVPLRDVANNAYFMDEMRADNAEYFYYAKDRGNQTAENLTNYLDLTDNVITLNRYQADYNGISRTNIILDRLNTITFTMSDAVKNQVSGEAKALRGHYYFDLVKNFGDVPLYLHEVTTSSAAYLPRSSADSVYNQIITDLTDAINLLSEPNFSAEQTGKVTKGTASMELAAVYMQRKQYDKALPLLQNISTMGYALLPNFRDVFNPANKNGNKEMIFDIQYKSGSPTDLQESNFPYRFTPLTPNTQVIMGVNFNNTIGGWNVPTPDLYQLFEAGDTRLDASIGVIEGTLDENTDFEPTKVVSTVVGYTPPAHTEIRWFCKKYYYPPYGSIYKNTDQNWPLYRFSDALLLLAECLNETGRSTEALEPLNRVRTRAFGAGKGQITTTDANQLRTLIANERRLELAFENKRYQDLIRTDQAIPVMTAYGTAAKARHSYLLPQTYNVTQNRLLYPIPQRERDLNTSLTQNPGY